MRIEASKVEKKGITYISEEEMDYKSKKSSRNYDKKTKIFAKGRLPSPYKK